ncbi:MAG TPA: PKD domain-containing protein, partial [Chitinophagaceae bacterium]|nr:PKD domain-containing protein [Chitinophagaceae bacterium]
MRKLPVRHLILLLCLYFTVSDTVSAQIKADFSSNITSGCAPLVVRFKDESLGSPSFWKWDLGNGTISYFQNPAATYFNPGTYTVKLVVSNGSSADSTVKTKYITVYALPVVNFTSSDTTGCFPLSVHFSDLTTPGDGSITKWLWDFGDGSTDTVQNPSHVYDALGNYNISLQTTNSFGCVSTLTRPKYIKLSSGVKTDFTFSAPNSCRPPTPISFTNLSTGTGILTYQWNFGDGGTSILKNPVHVYNSSGTYTVKLVTRNNTGCVDSLVITQAIIIGNVTASFTSPDTVCAGASFQLINSSSPNPTGASWTFGDGTTSTEIDPQKTFATPGIYQIKLVSDFGACKDSATKNIFVLPKPFAAFTGINTSACKPPLTTNFNSSVGGAIAYKWFFGDGDSSSLQNPSHTYSSTGDFDVTLIVTNAAGCSDTLRRNSFVKIHAPRVTITNLPQEGCIPFAYQGALNVQAVDSVVSYQWDFGDGGAGTGPAPVHTYTVAGTYSIRIIITTAGGCTDTVTQGSIRVGVRPIPAFVANPRIGCAFQPIRFS